MTAGTRTWGSLPADEFTAEQIHRLAPLFAGARRAGEMQQGAA